MPVMGPNLDAAHVEGRKIGEELLKELMEKHHLLDVSDPKYDKVIFLPTARERWNQAKEHFIEAVGQLFVEDASNSF